MLQVGIHSQQQGRLLRNHVAITRLVYVHIVFAVAGKNHQLKRINEYPNIIFLIPFHIVYVLSSKHQLYCVFQNTAMHVKNDTRMKTGIEICRFLSDPVSLWGRAVKLNRRQNFWACLEDPDLHINIWYTSLSAQKKKKVVSAVNIKTNNVQGD